MASTLSAKELSLAKIFSDEFVFTIPGYQRPYSWGREQAEDLLTDLLGYMKAGSGKLEDISPYFLGSLVLIKGEGSPSATVVDGQQRLTTLTLLLSCIRSTVQEPAVRAGITRRIYEQGDIVSATENHYRLTLRERDKKFFREQVQHEGGIEDLVQTQNDLSDSQARLRDNARYFLGALKELLPEELVRLVQFIVTRCYLVAVSTPDLDSAYRIFGVMNSRGLDLTATDILKAEIVEKLPEAVQGQYTATWEELEEDLGRDGFNELFSHIRMIYRKEKPKGTLLKEFRQHVAPADAMDFIDNVLKPMAVAFSEIEDASYASIAHAEQINDSLRWLNRIEFKDWMPPALAYFAKHRRTPERILNFVRELERLSYTMLIRRSRANERIMHFSRLTAAIENGEDLMAPGSALQLSPKEKGETWSNLNGALYDTHYPRALSVILLRIDALLSDGSKTMHHDLVTVEHVLPQNPKDGGQWVRWVPEKEKRAAWVHRLGNLALLSRKKNSSASNYEFDRKKSAYFTKGGVTAFALTTEVLQANEWTEAIMQARHEKLLSLAEAHWNLQDREIPLVASQIERATTASADVPVFSTSGLGGSLFASGQPRDGHFVVLAGSKARADWQGKDGGYRSLHDDLVESGALLAAAGGFRTFARDISFSSPSAAAAVVWGRAANGRLNWRIDDTDQSYAEWEEGVVADAHESEDEVGGVREEQVEEFWANFLAEANARGSLYKSKVPSSKTWLGTSLGRSGFRLSASLKRRDARIACLIHHPEGGSNIFDLLHVQRESIERDFGGRLEWKPLPDQKRSRIQLSLPAIDMNSSEEALAERISGLVDAAYRMDGALRDRIAELDVDL